MRLTDKFIGRLCHDGGCCSANLVTARTENASRTALRRAHAARWRADATP